MGGGFNPVGLNHEELGTSAAINFNMPVWMMPCYHHRFAKDAELTESHHRWNMTCLHCEDTEFLWPCSVEIDLKHNGTTYELMEKMTRMYPDFRFHILIGIDNANIIETKWHYGSELIQRYPFIVARNSHVPETTNWFLKSPHQFFYVQAELRATDTRRAIAEKRYEDAARSVKPKVWNYIQRHSLFGYEGA